RIANAAIGDHWSKRTDSANSNARASVARKRFQHHVAYAHITLHVRTQALQRLQAHTGILVITQGEDQGLADALIVRLLGQNVDRIEPDAGVVISARGIQQQLPDLRIIHGAVGFIGNQLLIADVDGVALRILRDAAYG